MFLLDIANWQHGGSIHIAALNELSPSACQSMLFLYILCPTPVCTYSILLPVQLARELL